MNNENLWQRVLDELRLTVSKPIFQTLFSQTLLDSLEKHIATVSCPNPYVQSLVESRYYSLIKNLLDKYLKDNVSLVFIVKHTLKEETKEIGPLFKVFDQQTGLNPKFSFSTFIVGNSNNFAYAAAQAIVQTPGTAYNPFFIWGGVGVGKTHLMQAIGHAILEKNPIFKILYAPAESFVNEFIQSLPTKTTASVKKKYRSPDVLLIDDVQFLAKKESSQEEFFHTFNALYLSGRQIVLTSDRPPAEISKVEERLISRFLGGLTVDIQSPDYEMRVAILRAKCQERSILIEDQTLDFLAQMVNSNARELTGVLFQIAAQAASARESLTLDFVKRFFGLRNQKKTKNVLPKNIVQTVSQQFNIKTNDLLGPCRKAEYVLPRQIIMFLLREELAIPLMQIGDILGGRDHTTVIYGVNKIQERFNSDTNLRHQIMLIKQALYG